MKNRMVDCKGSSFFKNFLSLSCKFSQIITYYLLMIIIDTALTF